MKATIAILKKQIKQCLDNGDYVGAKNQCDKLVNLTEKGWVK